MVYVERAEGKSTFKKALALCLVLILMGVIDWLTTVLGVLYFGAVEVNPLFASVINSNILAYSGIKLAAAVFIGFLFYKGYSIEKASEINSSLGKLFLGSGYFASLTALTVIVANNILVVISAL